MISMSHAVSNTKKEYYRTLNIAQTVGNVQPWMDYFGDMLLEAQRLTREKLKVAIIRKHIDDHFLDELKPTQKTVLNKMLNMIIDQ